MLSNNYILILVWCALLGCVALMIPQVYRYEKVNEEFVKRITPFFAVIAAFPFIICTFSR